MTDIKYTWSRLERATVTGNVRPQQLMAPGHSLYLIVAALAVAVAVEDAVVAITVASNSSNDSRNSNDRHSHRHKQRHTGSQLLSC